MEMKIKMSKFQKLALKNDLCYFIDKAAPFLSDSFRSWHLRMIYVTNKAVSAFYRYSKFQKLALKNDLCYTNYSLVSGTTDLFQKLALKNDLCYSEY